MEFEEAADEALESFLGDEETESAIGQNVEQKGL